MKIIFLDIDGVLNSNVYYRTVDRSIKDWNRFDPKVVGYIKKLVEEFPAKIVISSTWRFGAVKQLKNELKKSNLNQFLHNDWGTPKVYPPHRGEEIRMWLEKHHEITNYIIIDDDESILEKQMMRLIKTNINEGMTEEHYFIIREIFY